jgi:hypothetical protein
MTFEYSLKGLISAPMSFVYGSDAMKEAETTHLILHDPEDQLEKLDPSVTVLDTDPVTGFKHVEIPRYMHFTEVMLKLSQCPSFSCINIAGHDKIQVDVNTSKEQIPSLAGLNLLYQIPTLTYKENRSFALEVHVKYLCEIIRHLGNDGIEVLFIHDF